MDKATPPWSPDPRSLTSQLSGLTALRAIKQHPDGEVIREVFEAVLDVSGDEEKNARCEGAPGSAVYEGAGATYDDIHLVAGVRRLIVDPSWRVHPGGERAVPKEDRVLLRRGSRELCQSIVR